MAVSTPPRSKPKLSEVARHLIYPPSIVDSVWPTVSARLEDAGVRFDPWQQGFSSIALGLDANGKFASTVGGVVASIPRQIGKTFTIGHLLVGLCLAFPGFQAIWTSHHSRTTTATFQSMQGLVRNPRIYRHLRHEGRSDGIRATNGEQEIRFKNGSVIMFGAREHGFGRGMSEIDAEVFDEAQKLSVKTMDDMVPATNQARNPHGGLLFYIGTPPRPLVDDGEVFTLKRGQALSGKKNNLVYVEFSADENADPHDESIYPTFNPSYPDRTPLESMQRMLENLDPESIKLEMLGIWPTERHTAIIPASRWEALESSGPEQGVAPDSYGVAAHDGQFSVVACWGDGDERHLEEVFGHLRLDLVADWIVEHAGKRAPVLVPNYGAAAPLQPMLHAKRVNAKHATLGDVGKGCELLVEGAEAGWLSHGGQTRVTNSLAGARKKLGRDGAAWTFDLKASIENAPIMAGALALTGATAVVRRKRSSSGRRAVVL